VGAVDDEAFYEKVAEEVAAGQTKPGLWTKAFSQAGGDYLAARALYIRLRVEQLIEESAQIQEEAARSAKAAEKAAREARRDKRFGTVGYFLGALFLAPFVLAFLVILVSGAVNNFSLPGTIFVGALVGGAGIAAWLISRSASK